MKNRVIMEIVAMVLVTSIVGIVAASRFISTALAFGAGSNKVTTCQGNNDRTQTTGAPSVPAHIRNQGSYLGACQ
jgi:hypothetical protein